MPSRSPDSGPDASSACDVEQRPGVLLFASSPPRRCARRRRTPAGRRRPPRARAPRPGPSRRALGGGDDGGLDRLATGRQLAQRRRLQVAEHRHRHRARDRRRGHDQDVRLDLGAVDERRPLLDPEPVLLVDDEQSEVGELHVLLDQRVRADDDAGLAGRGVVQRLLARLGAERAGEQLYPGRVRRLPRACRPARGRPAVR